jgi:hypothetical protein
MEIVSDEEPDDVDIDMGGININESRVEEDESTAGEQYSKPVGDRTFQKFLRRIERAPEQIIRYSALEGLVDIGISVVEWEKYYIVLRKVC